MLAVLHVKQLLSALVILSFLDNGFEVMEILEDAGRYNDVLRTIVRELNDAVAALEAKRCNIEILRLR